MRHAVFGLAAVAGLLGASDLAPAMRLALGGLAAREPLGAVLAPSSAAVWPVMFAAAPHRACGAGPQCPAARPPVALYQPLSKHV